MNNMKYEYENYENMKIIPCFRHTIILCLLFIANSAYSEVPRCSDFLSIERKLNETTMTFEVETNQTETNSLFEVLVFVSKRCQKNLCSLRVGTPNQSISRILETGSPMRLRTKFFNQSKNAFIYAIFYRSSTECKVLCSRGGGGVALKRKKTMKYTYYPKGRSNSQEYPCDYDNLLLASLESPEGQDTPTTPSIVDEREEICGTTSADLNFSTNENSEMQRGDWPWLAAIYIKKDMQIGLQCSGVVVSETAIIVPARCLYDHDHFFSPKDITIFLGKYDLLQSSEVGFTTKAVRDVFIHPSYKPYSYRHDVAILKTYDHIEFTDYIAPACIWGSYPPIDESCKCDVVKLVDWDTSFKKNESYVPISTMTAIKTPDRPANPGPQSDGKSELLYDIDIRLGFESRFETCNDRMFGIALLLNSGRWILRGTGVYCKGNDFEAFEMHTDISDCLDWIMTKIVD